MKWKEHALFCHRVKSNAIVGASPVPLAVEPRAQLRCLMAAVRQVVHQGVFTCAWGCRPAEDVSRHLMPFQLCSPTALSSGPALQQCRLGTLCVPRCSATLAPHVCCCCEPYRKPFNPQVGSVLVTRQSLTDRHHHVRACRQPGRLHSCFTAPA